MSDKEKRIQETMQALGVPREEAEIIYDHEQSNTQGDEFVEDENDPSN
jgi:hypothetical protein